MLCRPEPAEPKPSSKNQTHRHPRRVSQSQPKSTLSNSLGYDCPVCNAFRGPVRSKITAANNTIKPSSYVPLTSPPQPPGTTRVQPAFTGEAHRFDPATIASRLASVLSGYHERPHLCRTISNSCRLAYVWCGRASMATPPPHLLSPMSRRISLRGGGAGVPSPPHITRG